MKVAEFYLFHKILFDVFHLKLHFNVRKMVLQPGKLAKAHLESRHRKTTGSDFKDLPNKIWPNKLQAPQSNRNRNPY